jgi:hypothetical protein
MSGHKRLLLVALLGALASGRFALAQSAEQLATAEALFREAQTLFDAGKAAEACPKFQASYDLDRGLGTLLNLARCYAAIGKTASAWALYVDLQNLASRAGQPDREAIAREQISALEPKLMRLQVAVPYASRAEGLTITLDGKPVEPATWGTATPRDPGAHSLAARAPGKRPWSQIVELGQEGATVVVDVPALEELPPEPVEPQPVPPASAAPPPSPSPAANGPGDAPSDGRSTRRIAGFVVGGVGIAGLVVSAALAGDAAARWSDAGCTEGLCATPGAQSDAEQALTEANLATGFVVGGGIALGLGALLVLTALDGEAGDSARRRGRPQLSAGGVALAF